MHINDLGMRIKTAHFDGFPDIKTISKPLDYALWILAAAKRLGQLELTATEISNLLLDAFDYHYNSQAISNAIVRGNSARIKKVLVLGKKGAPRRFRILQPGEDYLNISSSSGNNIQLPTKTLANTTELKDKNNHVFVVHGRNKEAKKGMHEFLRSIDITPLEFNVAVQKTGKPSPYIGEILQKAFSDVQAVVVLMTPDDEVQLKKVFWEDNEDNYEKVATGQARPNVLFEAGIAFGHIPDRTIFVELGKIKPFSDIAGKNIVKLNNSTTARQQLAQKLKNAGCEPDLNGTDWHSTGNFDI